MNVPTVESVLDQERYTAERLSEKYERKCIDCIHAEVAGSCDESKTFPSDLYEKIGLCTNFNMFITDEDTNFSEDCDCWHQ